MNLNHRFFPKAHTRDHKNRHAAHLLWHRRFGVAACQTVNTHSIRQRDECGNTDLQLQSNGGKLGSCWHCWNFILNNYLFPNTQDNTAKMSNCRSERQYIQRAAGLLAGALDKRRFRYVQRHRLTLQMQIWTDQWVTKTK